MIILSYNHNIISKNDEEKRNIATSPCDPGQQYQANISLLTLKAPSKIADDDTFIIFTFI